MIKNKVILVLLILFAVASAYGQDADAPKKFLKDVFKETGVYNSNIDDFIIRKDILRTGKENSFRTIIAEKDGKRIKIEVTNNIDPESAEKYIEERRHVINSLYRHVPSPYPGMISNTIEIPQQLKPKVLNIDFENKEKEVTILSSTARFTYGASAEDLIKYRGGLLFLYDENKNSLYRIDLFIPKEEFNQKEAVGIMGSFKFENTGNRENGPLKVKKGWKYLKGYNLIVIGFEPLGANHVGAYGYSKNTTPNLDEFAKNSFLFKNAVSPSSWTLPVFMSWFTSLYPSQHRITNKYCIYTEEVQEISNLKKLSPEAVTLAQVLKENRYSTAGFTGDAGINGMFGYDSGFDVYFDSITFAGFDITMPMAAEWIRGHEKDKFFLFIQGYDVHGRHELPVALERSKEKRNFSGTVDDYWKLRNLNLDQGYVEMDDKDVRFWRDWYDRKIFESDKRFGKFLAEFDNMDISRKTVIVVASGSGNEFFEHERIDHGHSLYDELTHVPLIIRIPGKKSREIKIQVRMIDLMPTILTVLNIPVEKKVKNQMQGISLIPVMEGRKYDLDAFSETDYLLSSFKRSVRTSDGWKYIYSMDTEVRELYDLNKDPGESNNLIEQETDTAYKLEQKLFRWLKKMGQNKNYHIKIQQETLKQ
ncbi:MAG: sulfatase [Elusimicrobiota bacterium]